MQLHSSIDLEILKDALVMYNVSSTNPKVLGTHKAKNLFFRQSNSPVSRAFALHKVNPSLIPGTPCPPGVIPEGRSKSKPYVPPDVAKNSKGKKLKLFRCWEEQRTRITLQRS